MNLIFVNIINKLNIYMNNIFKGIFLLSMSNDNIKLINILFLFIFFGYIGLNIHSYIYTILYSIFIIMNIYFNSKYVKKHLNKTTLYLFLDEKYYSILSIFFIILGNALFQLN